MASCTYTVYLSRHGQSQANVEGIIGGDTGLSEAGTEYSERLCAFIASSVPDGCPIWTSTLQRTIQTVRPLRLHQRQQSSKGYSVAGATTNDESHYPSPRTCDLYPQSLHSGLDEIFAGVCDGMTMAEAEAAQPAALAARGRDKLRFRYPDGESYGDLSERVYQECIQLEADCHHRAILSRTLQSHSDLSDLTCPAGADSLFSGPCAATAAQVTTTTACVVAHQATLRCVLAYFMGTATSSIPHVSVPLHTVFTIVVTFCPVSRKTLGVKLDSTAL